MNRFGMAFLFVGLVAFLIATSNYQGIFNKKYWTDVDLNRNRTELCRGQNNQIHLTRGCPKLLIEAKIDKLKSTGRVYILSEMVSSNERAGVHIEVDGQWMYSYHSGDGRRQVLYSEVSSTSKNINILLEGDETGRFNSDSVVNKIVIATSLEYLLKDLPDYSNIWVRTNNPNRDFWFDRYSSLQNNFTVTLPNEHSTIWERPFGIGVNDRFNSGDYYCYPDDKLLFVHDGKMTWFYLGFLNWKRAVVDDGSRLKVSFEYVGSLKAGPHANRQTLNKVMPINFGEAKIEGKLNSIFKLKKTYYFNAAKRKAEVELSLTENIFGKYSLFWIVEDAAYMDFNVGNNADVHSVLDSGVDLTRFYFSNSGVQMKGIAQVRLRRGGKENLISSYSGDNVNLYYALNDYLAKYTVSHPDLSEKLARLSDFEFEKPEVGPRVYGIGFKMSSTSNQIKKYQMHFCSNFEDSFIKAAQCIN